LRPLRRSTCLSPLTELLAWVYFSYRRLFPAARGNLTLCFVLAVCPTCQSAAKNDVTKAAVHPTTIDDTAAIGVRRGQEMATEAEAADTAGLVTATATVNAIDGGTNQHTFAIPTL
jgi:hypothetical protein